MDLEKQRKHLQSIAVEGGKRGGKARMESMTPDERSLLGVRAAMAKLKRRGKPGQCWVAQVHRPGERTLYAVMGCAADAEAQFRQTMREVPEVQVISLARVDIDPTTYLDRVARLRKLGPVQNWNTRAVVQVVEQGKMADRSSAARSAPKWWGVSSATLRDDWMRPKRVGRPPRQPDANAAPPRPVGRPRKA